MSTQSNPTSPKLEMQFLSDPAALAPARKAVESFCQQHGLGEHETADMGLCVNEALANIIRHAYGGVGGRPIFLKAEVVNPSAANSGDTRYDGLGIRVTIRDWGNGINPVFLPPKPRDPLVPGGIGLMCLKRMMDDIAFLPQPDGMLLNMTKFNE